MARPPLLYDPTLARQNPQGPPQAAQFNLRNPFAVQSNRFLNNKQSNSLDNYSIGQASSWQRRRATIQDEVAPSLFQTLPFPHSKIQARSTRKCTRQQHSNDATIVRLLFLFSTIINHLFRACRDQAAVARFNNSTNMSTTVSTT